jgi:hypothetical protein
LCWQSDDPVNDWQWAKSVRDRLRNLIEIPITQIRFQHDEANLGTTVAAIPIP